MSKQLLINERPNDNGGGFGGGVGEDWPKASIGNYKGVMLCNRPNELGQQRKLDKGGLMPFNPRVNPLEPLGWNPCKKLQPFVSKRKIDPNNILFKHKRFLKNLEEKKIQEKIQKDMDEQNQMQKVQKFKENAAVQRKKVKDLKQEDTQLENNQQQAIDQNIGKLTEENLKKNEGATIEDSKKPQSKAGQGKDKKQKPMWALTEKQIEEQKEQEIDDLLEFAYELDYEKYMEDQEVRQALAIIKDRVIEIKKDQEWKQKFAKEWNLADEAGIAAEDQQKQKQLQNIDNRSEISYKSVKTGMSKQSLRSQVMEAVEKEKKDQEWDPSIKSEKQKITAEDRMAQKLANEILKENIKLKGVHSNQSIKKILEKEAKKQLLDQGGEYKGPLVSLIKDKEKQDMPDPSNLPYLHKNPAI